MKELEDNREVISSDLNTLAYLLNYYQLCTDTSPIYNALGKCNDTSTDSEWSYSIDNLCFDLVPHSHTLPNGADLIQLLFSIRIKGNYYTPAIYAPATDLELNIELRGYDQSMKSLHASWHLDKHIYQDGDGHNKYYHPEYHFTFGGRKMWETGYDYGATLLFPTPRLVHPPLDGILGIDLVIQNYMHYQIHKPMTETAEYQNILRRAQLRMWKPFFTSIASIWNKELDVDTAQLPPYKILPNIS